MKIIRYYLRKFTPIILVAVLFGFAIMPCKSWAGSKFKGFYIVDPGRHAKWAGKWTNWAFQFPIDASPILDETGEFCDQGQSGRVWFLAGSFFGVGEIVRECSIPYRKALFFPIAQGLSFKPEFPEEGDPCLDFASPVEQVRCDVNDDIVPVLTDLEVTIDGMRVEDPFAYRAQSPPGGFVFSIPEGSLLNQFGFDAGDRYPAVADGYWLMVIGLARGSHEIHIFAEDQDGYQMDVTYHLTIGSIYHQDDD